MNWDWLQRSGNESTIFLNEMNGLDANCSTGVIRHMDNYFRKLIGFALLSSAFTAGIEVSQTRDDSVL